MLDLASIGSSLVLGLVEFLWRGVLLEGDLTRPSELDFAGEQAFQGRPHVIQRHDVGKIGPDEDECVEGWANKSAVAVVGWWSG